MKLFHIKINSKIHGEYKLAETGLIRLNAETIQEAIETPELLYVINRTEGKTLQLEIQTMSGKKYQVFDFTKKMPVMYHKDHSGFKLFEISIFRVIAGKPDKLQEPPAFIVLKARDTIDAKRDQEILKLIGQTYGKQLILQIENLDGQKGKFYQYTFEKKKAII